MEIRFSSETCPAACFAFHNGDKVCGEKVYEHAKLGRKMPARRPQHPKGSGAISVVVQHSDKSAVAKLQAYGEVWQVGDAQPLFSHTD
jgi:hypothetical protein